MKKMGGCPGGGYKELQKRLLAAPQEVTCEVCIRNLKMKKFDEQELEAIIEDVKAGRFVKTSPVKKPKQKSDDEHAEGAPEDIKKEKEDKHRDPQESAKEVQAYLDSFEGIFTVLPAGSHGKRFPIRCNLCKTRAWPDGKVIEGDVWKLSSVEYFVGKHCESNKHQGATRRMEPGTIVVRKQPCGGLHTADPERILYLQRYLAEFNIWATYSNFSGSDKHGYSWDKNRQEWIIKSIHCLKEVEEDHFEFPTCTACLELASSHGVSWTHWA